MEKLKKIIFILFFINLEIFKISFIKTSKINKSRAFDKIIKNFYLTQGEIQEINLENIISGTNLDYNYIAEQYTQLNISLVESVTMKSSVISVKGKVHKILDLAKKFSKTNKNIEIFSLIFANKFFFSKFVQVKGKNNLIDEIILDIPSYFNYFDSVKINYEGNHLILFDCILNNKTTLSTAFYAILVQIDDKMKILNTNINYYSFPIINITRRNLYAKCNRKMIVFHQLIFRFCPSIDNYELSNFIEIYSVDEFQDIILINSIYLVFQSKPIHLQDLFIISDKNILLIDYDSGVYQLKLENSIFKISKKFFMPIYNEKFLGISSDYFSHKKKIKKIVVF